MLILKRNPGQRIVINGNITIEVLPHDPRDGRAVRLGVTAPIDVVVDREEVHQQRQLHPDSKS